MFYRIKGSTILEVYIGKNDYSKIGAEKQIKKAIQYVSCGIFHAVIYVFENGDVLQFTGRQELFYVESVKVFGKTPNLCILTMPERECLSGEYTFPYCGQKVSENLSAMVTGAVLYEIIEYTFFHYNEGKWGQYIKTLCEKLHLKSHYYFLAKGKRVNVCLQ